MTNPKDPFTSQSGGIRGGAIHRGEPRLQTPEEREALCMSHLRTEDDETPDLPEQEEVSCPTCGGSGAVFRDIPPDDDDDPMVLAGLRESQLDEAIELGRELGQLRRRTGAAKELTDSLVAAMEPNSKGTFATTESVISAFKAIRAKLTDEAGGAQ